MQMKKLALQVVEKRAKREDSAYHASESAYTTESLKIADKNPQDMVDTSSPPVLLSPPQCATDFLFVVRSPLL